MKRLVILLLALGIYQAQPCRAPQIVANGLAAFDAGITQIGPWTNRADYARAGDMYIRAVCDGDRADWLAEMKRTGVTP